MKVHQLLCLVTAFVAAASCTLDKTDYEAEIAVELPEPAVFEEALSVPSGNYILHVASPGGTLYKGYNELRFFVSDAQTGEKIDASSLSFHPMQTDASGNTTTCPYSPDLIFDSENRYFTGYVVFTEVSDSGINWQLDFNFSTGRQRFSILADASVEAQPNKNRNMTSFTGNDGSEYLIALVEPQRPNVALNDLVAGIFVYDPAQSAYLPAGNYTVHLDPRMPEPSMGNHSSPNNQDLAQEEDGFYHGVVNYTMTGNWTLNFILRNPNGLIVKGTEVPTDFTPGIEGAKSELFLDILF